MSAPHHPTAPREPAADTPDVLETDEGLVSVVIPVLDRPHTIVDAVESVVSQDDVRVEVIVVDDGSGPETADAVDRLAAAHPQVRAVHQPNRGPSAARNRGIAESSGHWITFVDSDDLMTPGRLRAQVTALRAHEGPALVMGEEHIEVAPGVRVPDLIASVLARPRPHWYPMTVMTTRAVLDEVGGFDETMRLGEDTELLYRTKAHGVEHVRVEQIWTIRRILGDNLVADDEGVRRASLIALRKQLRRGAP